MMYKEVYQVVNPDEHEGIDTLEFVEYSPEVWGVNKLRNGVILSSDNGYDKESDLYSEYLAWGWDIVFIHSEEG